MRSKDSYSTSVEIDIRFRDLDPMGHVNNAVYATYLEMGRVAYWARCAARGTYGQVPFVLAHVTIDYRSPVILGEVIVLHTGVVWVGSRSFGMEYHLEDKSTGRLIVEAKSTQVTYDYERQVVIEVSDELRRKFEAVEGRRLGPRPEAW